MSNATIRAVLRWIHLFFAIPILGYVYSPFAELPSYAPIARFVAVPVVLLTGLWMYAGVLFAAVSVVVWLGAYILAGVGVAIVSVAVLLLLRKLWLAFGRRGSS